MLLGINLIWGFDVTSRLDLGALKISRQDHSHSRVIINEKIESQADLVQQISSRSRQLRCRHEVLKDFCEFNQNF